MLIFITSFNTLPFLKNAVRSMREFSPGCHIWICDNGSTDGSFEWAEANADIVTRKSNETGHWGAMDDFCRSTVEEVACVCDSDVEFTADPFVGAVELMAQDKTIAALYPLLYETGGLPIELWWDPGKPYKQMSRIDPCCAIIKPQRIVDVGASWITHNYADRLLFGDVGAVVKEKLELAGYKCLPSDRIRSSIIHYGNSSWPAGGCTDAHVLERVARNREIVEAKCNPQAKSS